MSVSRFAGQATKNFRGINLPTITDFMPKKEDYGKTVSQGIAERGATEATSLTEQARMMSTGIGAKGAIESAKYGADATRSAGRAAGRASMFGGLASGIGSLGAGAVSRFGSRPAMSTSIDGVNDNPIPGQTGDSIIGGRGTVVDSTYGITTPFSGGMVG